MTYPGTGGLDQFNAIMIGQSLKSLFLRFTLHKWVQTSLNQILLALEWTEGKNSLVVLVDVEKERESE